MGQFEAAELIRNMITKRNDDNRTRPIKFRCTSEPIPCYKVPLSCMYSQPHKPRSKLQVQQMLWMGAREMFRLLNAAQYQRKVTGPMTPALPHCPINRYHQHPHHLYPLPRLPNRSVTTARSTFYYATLTESGTS